MLDTEPGDTITYTLSYSNDINAGSTNGLTISETVPAETTFLPGSSTAGWVCAPDNTAGSSCTLNPADIAPGGSGDATFAVQVDAMVTAAVTAVSNTASIDATNMVNAMQTSDTTPITASAELAVTKSDNNVIDTVPGGIIAYNITASNTGNRVASNSVLTEVVPVNTTYVPTLPFTWNCTPNNDAGSTCTTNATDLGMNPIDTTFHVQVIDSVPAGTMEVSNDVTLSADNAASAQASDNTPITSSALLTINMDDGGVSVIPGDSVVYQMAYDNVGNQDAADTIISINIIDGTQFEASLSAPGWSCPGIGPPNTCIYDIGTLSGGDGDSVDFALNVLSPVSVITEELNVSATIQASNASTQFANDVTPVIADASLRIVKTDGGITAGLDKVINYALIIFNDGNQDAEALVITETVPDHTTFYAPASTTGWSCLPDNNAGSTCTFDSIFLGGDGGKNTVFFAVKTPLLLDPKVTTISNTASISAASTSSTDQDSEETPVDSAPPVLDEVNANLDLTPLPSCSQNNLAITTINAFLAEDSISGLIGANDVNNYQLIDTGEDQDLQSIDCDDVLGDDQAISIDSLSLSSGNPISLVSLTLSQPLGRGQYVFKICDSITDAAGNRIDGDGDGLAGGSANHQFRVEPDNLFDNAYFDDCTDNPSSLNSWNTLFIAPDDIQTTNSEDIINSSLSGSVRVQSNSSSTLGIEQCVNIETFGSHTISMNTLGIPSQIGSIQMNLLCAFREGLACSGSISGLYSNSFNLPSSTTPTWINTNDKILLPDVVSSALCTILFNSPEENSFELYLDEISLIETDLIFKNGYEELN